ncbi:hypothetical protein Hanom_Chr09g00854781 [Helianthus anomalus]
MSCRGRHSWRSCVGSGARIGRLGRGICGGLWRGRVVRVMECPYSLHLVV